MERAGILTLILLSCATEAFTSQSIHLSKQSRHFRLEARESIALIIDEPKGFDSHDRENRPGLTAALEKAAAGLEKRLPEWGLSAVEFKENPAGPIAYARLLGEPTRAGSIYAEKLLQASKQKGKGLSADALRKSADGHYNVEFDFSGLHFGGTEMTATVQMRFKGIPDLPTLTRIHGLLAKELGAKPSGSAGRPTSPKRTTPAAHEPGGGGNDLETADVQVMAEEPLLEPARRILKLLDADIASWQPGGAKADRPLIFQVKVPGDPDSFDNIIQVQLRTVSTEENGSPAYEALADHLLEVIKPVFPKLKRITADDIAPGKDWFLTL